MTYPIHFPGADQRTRHPNRTGKPWSNVLAQPRLVLHTLEYNGWLRDPDTHPNEPDRWHGAPPHLVLNPNTGEIRQHIDMDKAAYSIRDNRAEELPLTWQVELWGKAANVPGYSDGWYQGLADFLTTFTDLYGVPRVFADFTDVQYGTEAHQRMTIDDVTMFSGILGHCHVGRFIDTHWDPGDLDVARLKLMMGDDDMISWLTDKTWMTMFHSGVPEVHGEGRYYCSNDGTWAFDPPWGEGPIDGLAQPFEKENAINHLLQGFALAAGQAASQ